MPTYRVRLAQTTTRLCEIEVEAPDRDFAAEWAVNRVEADKAREYEVAENSGELEVCEIEEIAPEPSGPIFAAAWRAPNQ